jgi:GNAT superfamily N-acetyltransferase
MARLCRFGFLELAGVEVHAASFEGEMVSYVFSVPVNGVVWLSDLGTAPRYRGKAAAAAALLTGVMESHRERGWSAFGLGADPPGVALYERLGFGTQDRGVVWVCA